MGLENILQQILPELIDGKYCQSTINSWCSRTPNEIIEFGVDNLHDLKSYLRSVVGVINNDSIIINATQRALDVQKFRN